MTLGILADDLTGACDVAGSFAAAGLRTTVRVDATHEISGIDVVVHDANVRDAAAVGRNSIWIDRFRAAVEAIEAIPASLGMLKIDSTLRGPVGTMVSELLQSTDSTAALFAPAFPQQGRYLLGGRLVLERTGAPQVDACALLEDAGLDVALVPVDVARSSVEDLEEAVLAHLGNGTHVVVVDSDGCVPLANVARVWQRQERRLLLVGSAGVARQLGPLLRSAAARRGNSSGSATSRIDHPARASGILVVTGSPTPEATAQLERLTATGTARLVKIGPPGGSMAGAIADGTESVRAGELLCLHAPLLKGARDRGEAAAALAEAVSDLAIRYRPTALVLVGGATSRAVLERLGGRAIEMGGEVEAGVPYGKLQGGTWHQTPVVTKAGAFGDEDALVRAVHRLREGKL